MNLQRVVSCRQLVLIMALALAGNVCAHPGNHGSSVEDAGASTMVRHFLTSMDHVGPVVAAALVAWVLWRWAGKSSRS